MLTPSFCSTSSWAPVKGLSHMNVFIAGATTSGREKSQALNCNAKEHLHEPHHAWHVCQREGVIVALQLCFDLSSAPYIGCLRSERISWGC